MRRTFMRQALFAVALLVLIEATVSCRHTPPKVTGVSKAHLIEVTSDSMRLADVAKIRTALDRYHRVNGRYPMPAIASTTGPTPADGSPSWRTFMAEWPVAPTPPDGTCTKEQNQYTYMVIQAGESYALKFCLGFPTAGLASGVHTADPLRIQ
jgi:hypothetical protein